MNKDNQAASPYFQAGTGLPQNSSDGALDFISLERNSGEFDDAKKHAKRVRFLKIAMPVAGVLIILGVLAALVIRQLLLPDLDLGSIRMQDGKLVMENPNLNGFDRHKRPFSLSADKAIQDADQPKRVELIDINARLPVDDTLFASIKAGNGVYDAEEKTLVLTRKVNVLTTDGMTIDLEDADVDIAGGILVTENPIKATSQKADISSNRLTVRENGKRLIFEGAVRMTLRPKELEKDNP